VIKSEVDFRWNRVNNYRFNYQFQTDSTGKNQKHFRGFFLSELGFKHVRELCWQRRSLEWIDIPVGNIGELHFLLTLKDVPFAYLVADSNDYASNFEYGNKSYFVPNYNGILLILEFNHEYKFHIRFEAENCYQEKGTNFKIMIKSWDDVRFYT
jgi:hypothetical protein